MKYHEFSQIIISKVKTALKEMIPRNIVEAPRNIVEAPFKLV